MFDLQSIRNGVDVVHMNRFQARIKPRRGATMPNAVELMNAMPQFLDPASAQVSISSKTWKANSTLVFRASVQLPPLIMTPSLEVPGIPIAIPIPPGLRTWTMPHSDVVGVVGYKAHGFTVETLRRRYSDRDDAFIRASVITAASVLVPALGPLIGDQIANYLVDVNQHHFLAGRRAFYMSAADNGEWLFDTAAVERFSREEFKVGVEAVYGSPEKAVSAIWMPMVKRVADHYGTLVTTGSWTHRVGTVGAVKAAGRYREIADMGLLPF